jgi:nucleotidyltransferase/DNA polymerase involved in DNA repair
LLTEKLTSISTGLLGKELWKLSPVDIGRRMDLFGSLLMVCRRCVLEKASVDEVYLDLTEEAQQLLEHSDPDSFSSEILSHVIESKVIISLGAPPMGPETKQRSVSEEISDVGEDDAEEIEEEEQHIRDICSQDHASFSTSSSPSSGNSTVFSPQEWLARPGSAWYSDGEDKESLERDRLLICASLLVTQIRNDILDRLGFTCSAGIAHTKMLAKVPLLFSLLPFSLTLATGGLSDEQTRQANYSPLGFRSFDHDDSSALQTQGLRREAGSSTQD